MDSNERLRDLIQDDPRSRRAKAEAIGMREDQLYQVETGRRADPSLSTVAKILAGLGLSWSALDGSD